MSCVPGDGPPHDASRTGPRLRYAAVSDPKSRDAGVQGWSVAEQIETVIIGGGQAGLGMSYYLRQLGREHIILERGRVAERWRSERWDSLTLIGPNWSAALPGHEFPGNPDAFGTAGEVVRFLESYAAAIPAPLRCGVRVTALRPKPDSNRLVVETDNAVLEAANVIVATGPFQEPMVPRFAAALPPDVVQVTSNRYTNPGQLPPGAVLVVGSATSGCQIAEDIIPTGRQVYLSVGRHRRVPRRYRGRDGSWWLVRIAYEQTVESLSSPDAKRVPGPLMTGVKGGYDIDLRRYPARGVMLLGHLQGYHDGRLLLASDLEKTLAEGDETLVAFRKMVDDYVTEAGIDAPDDKSQPDAGLPSTIPSGSMRELHLQQGGIGSVVWATGSRCDFRWIHFPIFDEEGEPAHRRGVTSIPGLYFLGLQWLYKRKSAFFFGIAEDAAYLAEHIAARM